LSPIRIILYNDEIITAIKNARGEITLSMDMTSVIVEHPNGARNRPPGIFILMAKCPSFAQRCPIVGIYITDSSKSYDVEYFLNNWIDNVLGTKKIKQFVTDADFAEINAACLAFNKMNREAYVEAALQKLSAPTSAFKCVLIRMDRNHVVKNFAKFKTDWWDSMFTRSMSLLVNETKMEVRIKIDFI